METRVIERFPAVGDDGNLYDVIITQEFHKRPSMNAENGELPEIGGFKEARLADGTALNSSDGGETFSVFDTGVILTRK